MDRKSKVIYTPLELPLLLYKNPPEKLNTILKSTGSGEHFDIKIKIVSTPDSEIPKSVLIIVKQNVVRFCSFWYQNDPMETLSDSQPILVSQNRE